MEDGACLKAEEDGTEGGASVIRHVGCRLTWFGVVSSLCMRVAELHSIGRCRSARRLLPQTFIAMVVLMVAVGWLPFELVACS